MAERDFPVTFRSEVIAPLVAKLRAGESVSLVGVGSIGKGNIIRQLLRPKVREHYFKDDATRVIFSYLDCNFLPDYTDQSVFTEILNVTSKALGELGETGQKLSVPLANWAREALTSSSQTVVRQSLRDAFDLILKFSSYMVVIIFDDCDALIREASESLLRSLRALRDAHKSQVMYVTVTRRELAQLRKESQDFQGFFELSPAHTIGIKPYRESDAFIMLEYMASNQKVYALPLSDAEMRRIYHFTGGHAGLLKQAYEATGHGERALDSDLMDNLLGMRLIWAECEKIWESLVTDELTDLQAIANGKSPLGDGLGPLEMKGLILEQTSGQFAIFSPLFAEFARAQTPMSDGDKSSPEWLIYLDKESQIIKLDRRVISISETEVELLDLLCARRPEPCSHEILLNRLMAVEPGGSPYHRLDQYLEELRLKLNSTGKQYLIKLPGQNWRLVNDNGE